jgi:hypothetical protein
MKSASVVIASAVLASLTAACMVEGPTGPDDGAGSSDPGKLDATSSSHCPSGNGFYVLYYGSLWSDFVRIHDAAPNFVVLGDGLEGRTDIPQLFHGNPYVRVYAYLPTGNGTNTLDARIQTAMDSKYDGVFFDEANSGASDYNAKVAGLVHARGGTVIMNPGHTDVGTDIFNYADIVSVENKWSSTLLPTGIDPWRWLAVQGDPSTSTLPDDQAPTTGQMALDRLDYFRRPDRGGFWYYASEYDAVNKKPLTAKLPSWFDTFATAVKGRANVTCTSTPPTPPTTPPVNNAGTGPYVLGIHTFDRANNAEFGGMWTTVQDTAGNVLLSGFSPIQYHLAAGSYRITTADYAGPSGTYTFHHWDEPVPGGFSTVQPRAVTLTASPTGLWTGAWYTVAH